MVALSTLLGAGWRFAEGPEIQQFSKGVSNLTPRGGGSETTLSDPHGEDKRRGEKRRHTSHTPGDPFGVGRYLVAFLDFDSICEIWRF